MTQESKSITVFYFLNIFFHFQFKKRYADMDSYAAGAFFGFASLLLYLVDGGYRLLLWTRRDRNPQQRSDPAPTY